MPDGCAEMSAVPAHILVVPEEVPSSTKVIWVYVVPPSLDAYAFISVLMVAVPIPGVINNTIRELVGAASAVVLLDIKVMSLYKSYLITTAP